MIGKLIDRYTERSIDINRQTQTYSQTKRPTN